MRLRIALLILLAGLAAAFARPASAQSCMTSTCTASSASESDVLAALPSPSNTNATVTVSIPTSTQAWTTGFSYTAPSAVSSLIIQGNSAVTCTGTPGTSSYACTPTDSTIIEDAYQSNSPLITIAAASTSQSIRITGLTIEGGAVGSGSCGAPSGQSSCSKFAMLNVSGTHLLRIDHNHFDTTTYTPLSGINSAAVRLYSETEGVLDHNYVYMGNNSSTQNGFQAFNTIGDSIGYGDGTWASPTNFGSSAFLFFEDNVFVGGAADDCNNAGRFVMRYNTINDAYVGVQNHSIKYYGGREQGCRAEEIYGNYFTGPATGQTNAAIGLNGGPAMVWGNNDAQGYYNFFASGAERGNSGQTEQPAPGSWGYCGTSVNSNGQGAGWDGNSPTTTGWPCLDGLGRGQMTQAMNGQNFPNAQNAVNGCVAQSPPTCSAWPQQYLEPMYLFMNTISSGNEGYFNDTSSAWERDVYPDCGNTSSDCSGSFNGTKGTGYGLLSARPSTCTAGPGGTFGKSPTGSYGVGYWASDANNGNGEFYACTAPNTWTAIYSPYTYPHPLDGGGGGGGGGAVTISPGNQNFGSVNVGSSSSPVTFTVSNGSSTNMTSVSVAITGTNASYFANTGGGTCGSSLASMASCTVILQFSPTAAGTNFTATLQVSYSGGDGSSPVTAGLSGAGVSSCSSPVSVNAYTICSSAFAETSSPNTTVSIPFTPYGGNGVEVFVEWCVIGCNAGASQTLTVSDNINSPETCFVAAPHSPYQIANTFVPDYPIVYAYYCPSIPSGVTQLTATVSGSVDYLSIDAQEIKAGQIAASGYFESVDQGQNSGNTANTTASISTSATTTNAADLVTALVTNCGGSIAATPGTGYTGITVNPSADPGWILEDMGVNAAGTQTATTTWSSGTASGNCALGGSAPNTTWWGAIVPLKGASSTPTLNPPTISPIAGAHSSPATITIGGSTGAVLCYTTNGTAPSASTPGTCDAGSTTYSGSFALTIPSGGATVQALATESGYTNSSIASVAYSLITCANTSLGGGWGCATSAGNSTGTTGTSLSLGPFPTNPPSGALIVVTGFNGSNAACAAPSDSLVSTWHLIVSSTVSADSLQLCAYWGVTTSAGADTVTWNSSANAAVMGGAATVYTTPSGTLSADKICSNSNATSSAGSNNAACSSGYANSGSNELNVFASYGDYSATITAGTNYTLVNAPAFLRDEYYMQASASAITPAQTLTTGLNYGAMGASFEIAAGSAPPLPPTALIVTPF